MTTLTITAKYQITLKQELLKHPSGNCRYFEVQSEA